MEIQWGALVRKVAAGDSESAELLARVLRERMLQLVHAQSGELVRTKVDEEDLASDAVLRALQGLDGFKDQGEGDDGFLAWVDTIGRNVIADARRRWSAQARSVAREERLPSRMSALGNGRPVDARTATTPSGGAVRNEEAQRLLQARALLDPQDRRVIDLREADLSWMEVSRLLGISEEASRKRWVRARERLTGLYFRLGNADGEAGA